MRQGIIVLISLLVIVTGCNNSCIKVGETYKDFSGEVEYCFSKKSEKLGVPVIEEKEEGKEETKEYFGFDLEQINKIVEKMKEKTVTVKTVSPVKRHPVEDLLDMLKKSEE